MEIDSLLEHLAHIIKVPIRTYDPQFKLMQVFGDFNAAPDSLADDNEILQSFVAENQVEIPLKIFERQGDFIAVIFDSKLQQYFLTGAVQTQSENQQKRIVSIDIETICETTALIYEYISDIKLSVYEILALTENKEELQQVFAEYLSGISFSYQEEGALHNPYDQEVREQSSIREGNREKLLLSFEESYSGRLATLSKNPLRSIKNLGIVVLAISTRAAIEGGLHPEQAFLLSDSFILKVDEAHTQTEILTIVRNAELFFTERVAEVKKARTENPMILRVKDLIFKNLHEKITLDELAEQLHTTPTYLSKIFKKEMGSGVHEFIIQEKLKMTESLLMYSDYTIEEIAHYYSFSSQSHYGSLFKKYYQLTPNKFRQKYGIKRGT
ncbi:helix-turn-helix domain-containing protein [Enterococcus sp. HY326]|uniref:helix-turn-helix domain-containing protein n=1 Tax=Enterococcus sp. HY326 TaxID=2971265 RepID=UPI002240AD7B|nr:helix-turn-helix domain-containing protein [Enterococcus sp. HY326]